MSTNVKEINIHNYKKIDSYNVTLSDKKLYKNHEHLDFISNEVKSVKKTEEYSIGKESKDLGILKLNSPYKFKFMI